MDDQHSDVSESHFFDFDAFQHDQATASAADQRSLVPIILPPANADEEPASPRRSADVEPRSHYQQHQPSLEYQLLGHGAESSLDAEQPRRISYPARPSAARAEHGNDSLVDAARPNISIEATVDLSVFEGPEKWVVNKDTAKYLSSVVELESSTEVDLEAVDRRPRPTLHAVKMPEPLLGTDPQMDMFALFERNKLSISTEGIKPFHVDIEKDEGVQWSQKSLALPQVLDRQIASERVEITKEIAEYLKDICHGPEFCLQQWFDSQRLQQRKHETWRKPISSPLLPLSPSVSPQEISPSAIQVDLTSTPEEPAILEVAELEAGFAGQDRLAVDVGAVDLIKQAESDWTATNNSSDNANVAPALPLKRKARSLKVLRPSSPLVLDELDDHAPKKTKTELSAEHTAIPIPSADSDDCFEPWKTAEQVVAKVYRTEAPSSAQEGSLTGSQHPAKHYTTLKVPIPELEEIKFQAPWNEYRREGIPDVQAQQRLLADLQANIMKSEKKWTGISKLERDLPWTPFPSHLAKVSLDEQFDDGACAKYLERLELDLAGEVDTRIFTWKLKGLRILDRDDEDDESINPIPRESDDNGLPKTVKEQQVCGDHPAACDTLPVARQDVNILPSSPTDGSLLEGPSLQALLQKRRLQMENKVPGLETMGERPNTHSESATTNSNRVLRNAQALEATSSRTGLFGFAQLQGWSDVLSQSHPQTSTMPLKAVHSPQRISSPPPRSTPIPSLHEPTRPFSVIISRKTMRNLSLIRPLTALLPNINLIERDYTLPSSSPAEEVDLILSPTTALLATTLQKIRQRPLPGHQPRPSTPTPFQTRLLALAPIYPTILIHITSQTSLLTLDPTDLATLTSLQSFATALSSSTIQIRYIPTESDLPTWIAATICQHHPTALERAPLLQDETLYERFLRRAGLNAYAAQVVLARDGRGGDMTGLAALIIMSPEERMERFAGVVGGERVVQRVNAALEGRWLSASNG